MRFDAIETITPLDLAARGSIVLHQSTSRLAAVANALILLPACLVMLAPFALVAAYATERPDALLALAEKPLAALQIALAFLMTGGLLAFAVRRLAARLMRSVRIEIDSESVRVATAWLLGTQRWQAPLASFAGVSHRVRSTLNGTRHELVLVHPQPARSVLIEIAPRIGDAHIEDVCRRFQLPRLVGGRAIGQAAGHSAGNALPIAA
jgi:hypothetical protein